MRKPPVAVALLTAGALVGAVLVGTPASAAPRGGDSGLEVYVGELKPAQLEKLSEAGFDHEDVATGKTRDGRVPVEVVMSTQQASKLTEQGLDLQVKRVNGKKASQVLAAQAAQGFEVFRPYGGSGGLREEVEAAARANPGIAKLVTVGQSRDGQRIVALKVTKNARQLVDGTRPAVLYNAAQHAREWITPEMVRRLMHHVLEGYGSDSEITRLVDTTELWFMPVSNPDGYDFTFTEGNRLWRKNLRDNDGDGQITSSDGVDPNRNFPTKWGYDDEGSSPDPSSQTYRGPAPASEPETRALDALVKRVGFEFQVNYHSAAELLLYGTGWQVSTPTPDDQIYEPLAGTDDNSAIPGYDPDISAELYTTNGETTEHVHESHGTLAFTPEMSTCQTISAKYPDDPWEPGDCASGFNFPDDERLVQEEFEKNIPFALSLARSADHPDEPESSVGMTAADFAVDSFAVSQGGPQPVAVTARRSLMNLRLWYSVNGGAPVEAKTAEWAGGERYGDEGDTYYAEYRGVVRGATRPGDEVEVWFAANKPGTGDITSERFTYTVADDIGGDVLVLAAEDVTGASPAQGVTSAKYADEYVSAVEAAGYEADVYDVDVNDRTAPHHLGVLSHYDAVVWETGDDILTREVGQPAGTAAELALDLELTVRDYLNEGGKVLYTGKYAGFASGANGVYYYNPFEEEQGECRARTYPCLPLFNDFLQYYLGAYEYVSDGGTGDTGPFPVSGDEGAFNGFSGTFNGGDSADNQDHTASFLTTSSFLPPDEFPQFASAAPLSWNRPGAAPYDPYSGDWYLNSQRADVSYKRLTRTVDLTGATGGTLRFQTSYNTEANWDYLFVEAHPVGSDQWTTLPEANGHTAQGTGDSCASGWNTLHPHVDHYQGPNCEPTGTTGEWHAATGSSNGWQEWQVDLSRYAGQQVEVSITYASDWGTQGLGVFLDDVAVLVGGSPVAETSFESDLGGWTVSGAPAGSAPNPNDWTRSQKAFEEGSAVTTEDTVYTGFGIEGLTTRAMREDLVARSLQHLLG